MLQLLIKTHIMKVIRASRKKS